MFSLYLNHRKILMLKKSTNRLKMAEEETFCNITFPKLAPEKAAGDYLTSKLEEQALRKYPQWDYPRIEPIVNLVEARRDLHQAELELEEKKNEAINQREKLDIQWKSMEKEALKIRETFCEFDKMIKENSQKRERAAVKTQKQKTLQSEKDDTIKDLQQKYSKLLKIRDEMENQIQKHSMYEEYLQIIAEAHPEYKTPQGVFNKFGALDEARNTLTERLDENLTTLEELKDKMLKSMKLQNTVLIGLNNRVAELYDLYSATKAKAQKWEEVIQKIQNACGQKLTEILNVRRVCWNIYLEICDRRKIKPQFDKSDFENQLWFIKKTLLKLKRTLEIALQKTKVEISSMCVERPISKQRL